MYNIDYKSTNIIQITASSVSCGSTVYNTLLDNNNCWKSNNEESSWIKYDFNNHKILLQSFDIRSSQGPKSFIFEGSNDDNTWTLLHSMNNQSDFKSGQYIRKHYECTSTTQRYRYIKITQGKDGGWDHPNQTRHYFRINNVYFYGLLYN